MTVNTTSITSGPYTGNGTLDEYSYGFRVEDKTQVKVFETTDLGAETTLTVDVDYTVNSIGVDGGGTITRIAGNLPADYIWYIRSNYVDTQLTAFASQGGFFPDTHEKVSDKLTFLIQQIQDTLGRSIRLSESDITGADTTLPIPEALRVIGWDATADELVNYSSLTTDSSTVAYIAPGTGAISRYAQDRMRERISILDFIPTSLHAAIAADTNIVGLSTYIQAAIDAVNAAGGGAIWVPKGTYLMPTQVLIEPFVSIICEGPDLSDDFVIWDYTGTDCAFYSDWFLQQVTLSLGCISHANNTEATGTVDHIQFRKGITACEVNVTMNSGDATLNGMTIFGKHPTLGTANNNQYRNKLKVVHQAPGITEVPGVGLWLESDNTPNSRPNGNILLPGCKLDKIATCVKVQGQNNAFYSPTFNGPASTAVFHFEGDGIYGNTIINPYNDAGVTGKFMIVDNESSVDLTVAHVINPVNELQVADISDISAGAPKGTVRVDQRGTSSGSGLTGRPHTVTFRDNVASYHLIDEDDTLEFTPEFWDASTGGNQGSASASVGRVRYQGDRAFLNISFSNMDTTGMTAGNAIYIRGLPKTAKSISQLSWVGSVWARDVTFAGYMVSEILSGDSHITLYQVQTGALGADLTVAGLSTGVSDVRLSIEYEFDRGL